MAEQFIVGRRRPRRSPGCTACGGRGARSPSTCSARRRSPRPKPTATPPGSTELLDALVATARGPGRPTTTSSATTSGRCRGSTSSIKPTALAAALLAAHPRGGPGPGQAAAAADPRAGRARRGAFVYFDMEHYDVKDLTLAAVPRPARRARAGRPRRRHRHPGLPARQPRRPRRPHRLVVAPAQADQRAAGEGRLLGHRDRHRPGRGLAGARVRAEGADRRQLRALRPAAARPPRRGAGRVRQPQPALARLRGHLRPRASASPTTATSSRCSTAWPSRSTPPSAASGCACACTRRWASSCPAWPTSCAGCSRTRPTRASCARRFAEGRDLDELLLPPDVDADDLPRPAEPTPRPRHRPRPALRPYEPEPPARVAAALGARRRSTVQRRRHREARSDGGARDHRRRAGRRPRRRSTRSTRPGPMSSSAARRRAAWPRPTPRSRPPSACAERWAAHPRRRARRGAVRCGGVDAGPARRAGARSQVFEAGKPWKRGRRRRLRGHRLLRVLRPRGAAPRRAAASCSHRRARRTRCATGQGRRCRHRAVELPARDPHRHDHRRARRRQPRHPQARRADARLSRTSWSRRCTRPACPTACCSSCPVAARWSAPGSSSTPTCRSSCSPDRRRWAWRSTSTAAVHPAGAAPRQAGHRRDGRQERDHRRRRRRSRPGRPGDRAVRVRLRGPEVLGRVAGGRARRRARRGGRTASSAPPRELVVGHPRHAGVAGRSGHRRRRARAGIRGYIERGADGGRRSCCTRHDVPDDGWFVGPTDRRLACAPARRARAPRRSSVRCSRCSAPPTSTRPARSPTTPTTRSRPGCSRARRHHIERAPRELRGGNVYINRGTTGAIVGRQPFGGYGMSGVGSKAGGPDYLAAVPRPAGRHREHAAPRLRARRPRRGCSTVPCAAGGRPSRSPAPRACCRRRR